MMTPRLAVLALLVITGTGVFGGACSSQDDAARTPKLGEPGEEAAGATSSATSRGDVPFTPWSELPRAFDPILVWSPDDHHPQDLDDRALRATIHPPVPGCRVAHYERALSGYPEGIHPEISVVLVLECDDGTPQEILYAQCGDGAMALGAGVTPPPRIEVESALESFAFLREQAVGPGLVTLARRLGGVEPRALLFELGKRSARPPCLTQAARVPLVIRFLRGRFFAYLDALPWPGVVRQVQELGDELDAVKTEQERAALTARIRALEHRILTDPELYREAEDAAWTPFGRVLQRMQVLHLALLREVGGPPTPEAVRARLAGDAGLVAAVDALPPEEPVRAILRSYLHVRLPPFSAFVKARLDGEPGYWPIAGPSSLGHARAPSVEESGDRDLCQPCTVTTECREGQVCTTDFTDEAEGICKGWVDRTLAAPPGPGCLQPVFGPLLLPGLPTTQARVDTSLGTFCEPVGGCPSIDPDGSADAGHTEAEAAPALEAGPAATAVGALRTSGTYGGVRGAPLRFWALDDDASCVAVGGERPLDWGDHGRSASPVFEARRIEAAVTCDRRGFARVFSQSCTLAQLLRERQPPDDDPVPVALQPIFLMSSVTHYTALDVVAQTYGESPLAARRRLAATSPDPSCYGRPVANLSVTAFGLQSTPSLDESVSEEVRWRRFTAWPTPEALYALREGKPLEDVELKGPIGVSERGVDALEGSLVADYRRLFAEQRALLAFGVEVLAGEGVEWTGDLEKDAARAVLALWLTDPQRPGLEGGDAVDPVVRYGEAHLAWRESALVKESLVRVERWARTLGAEEQAELLFLLDEERARPGPQQRSLSETAVRLRTSLVAGRRGVGAEPVATVAICDLGRAWADEPESQWRVLGGPAPRWVRAVSWADLEKAARALEQAEPLDDARVCAEASRSVLTPLDEREQERFASLEVKRMNRERFTDDQAERLIALGSRLAWTTPASTPPDAARDAILDAHVLGSVVAGARCRTWQLEAQTNLKALFVAEESHRAEHDTFHGDLAALGFRPRTVGGAIRYRYEIVEVAERSFRAEATGVVGAVEGDVWEINERLQMVNVANACQGRGR